MRRPLSLLAVAVALALPVLLGLSPEQAQASWYYKAYLQSKQVTPPAPSYGFPVRPTPAQPTPTQPAPTQPTTPQPTPSQPPTSPDPSTSGLTSQEKLMLDLVNQERLKNGLKPLTVDMSLTVLARKKSQDMVDKNYFSHTSPTYGSPFKMISDAGISYRTAGENIAKSTNATKAFAQFLASPPHKASMLSLHYTRIGIGIVANGPYGVVVTQLFVG